MTPDEVRETIREELQGAAAMIGQAQERLKPLSELWKRLGELYEEIDGLDDTLLLEPEAYPIETEGASRTS
jgi:hypothetical protein